MAHEGRSSSYRRRCHHLVKVGDMADHGERLAAAAPLEGLEDME
jgi:hypothetical protein